MDSWGRSREVEKEKIRKAQWTPENTAKTQAIVLHLHVAATALEMIFGSMCPASHDMRAAIARFRELDGAVKDPAETSR